MHTGDGWLRKGQGVPVKDAQSQDNTLIMSSRLRSILTVLWTPLTVSIFAFAVIGSITVKNLDNARKVAHTLRTPSILPRLAPARPLSDARSAPPAARSWS